MEQLLKSLYGFDIQSLVDGPRGFVGETHIVTTKQGEKYFVKKVKSSPLVDKIIRGLPVLNELSKLGISNINYPIPSKDGSLYTLDNGDVIVVFNYILGSATFNFPKRKFFKLLASIHNATPDITSQLNQETFEISYRDQVESIMELSFNGSPKDALEKKTHTLMKKYAEEIHSQWMHFFELSEKCQTKQKNFVLTHGDAAGNVIMNLRGDIYLVDWDEILLAPPERDNWFHLDPVNKNGFLTEYKKYVPDYEPDKDNFMFYVHNRFFDDLNGFLEGIYNPNFPEEKRENYLKGLENDCFHWTLPIMRLK